MAELCSCRFSSSLLSSHKLLAIPKPLMSSISFFPIRTSIKLYPSLQINCSLPSSTSSPQTYQSPSTIVFIKGLSLSTSEGSLKKAFSQYGEVSRVKVVTDKEAKQSLGFAFVWFASEECAKLAVKEMDGKFFDGRFIFVTISKPGACITSPSPRGTPLKF